MSGVCDAQDHHHHPEMKCQYEAEHCFISFPVCYIYCLQVILDLTSGPANPMPMYWIYGSQEFAKWQKHLTCKRNGHNFENRVKIVLQRQCPRPVVNWRSELISVATKCGTCQILRGICPSSITAAATLGRTTQIDSIKYFWKRKIFLPRLARRLGLHVGWGGARRHGTQQMRCLGGNQNTIWHSRTPGSVNVLHRFKSSC